MICYSASHSYPTYFLHWNQGKLPWIQKWKHQSCLTPFCGFPVGQVPDPWLVLKASMLPGSFPPLCSPYMPHYIFTTTQWPEMSCQHFLHSGQTISLPKMLHSKPQDLRVGHVTWECGIKVADLQVGISSCIITRILIVEWGKHQGQSLREIGRGYSAGFEDGERSHDEGTRVF